MVAVCAPFGQGLLDEHRQTLAVSLTAALGAAAGAAITSNCCAGADALSQHRDDAADLKTWENEGGNLDAHAVPSVDAVASRGPVR